MASGVGRARGAESHSAAPPAPTTCRDSLVSSWPMPKRLLCALVLLPALTACNGSSGERLSAILDLEGDADAGASFYSANCSVCHGSDAGGGSGPAIAGEARDVVVEAMLEGPDQMPSFSGQDDQDLADVATFVSGL